MKWQWAQASPIAFLNGSCLAYRGSEFISVADFRTPNTVEGIFSFGLGFLSNILLGVYHMGRAVLDTDTQTGTQSLEVTLSQVPQRILHLFFSFFFLSICVYTTFSLPLVPPS